MLSQLLGSVFAWDLNLHLSYPQIFLVCTSLGLAYQWYYNKTYGYFKRRGIPGPTPMPLLGTSWRMFTEGILQMDIDAQKKWGKVYGIFLMGKPTYMISDQEMLSDIFVKEFSAFPNHPKSFDFPDEILQNMLTMMDDEQWKRVRSLLTPTFSSGKLKNMAGGVNQCCNNMNEHLSEMAEKDESFEAKTVCGKFTMDLTAKTAFGIDINSFKDPDNPFITYGKKMNFTSIFDIRILVAFFFPFLIRPLSALGMKLFDQKGVDFFVNATEQAMNSREKGNKQYQDFIQLMANAHQDEYDHDKVAEEVAAEGDQYKVETGKKKGLNRIEILASSFLFFVAGYENIANTLTLLLYCLTVNEDCQRKVQEEIDEVMGDKEEISYNDVKEMVYLDQCLQESMRRYTLAFRNDRECKRDVVIKGIKIEKGTVVNIPVHAIHMDPEIWPEPEKFDPDRFSPEEKAKHSPFDHLPFGYGPRNCIAMRLSLMETKMAVASILKTYNLVKGPKTEEPLKFSSIGHSSTENGVWLKVEKRA